MVDINFNAAGQFKGVQGQPNSLENPTSLQFGPDGRLYVSEQNGTINAFTVTQENDSYSAIAVEEINLVKQIQNHNDDGSLSELTDRQVTGLVVTGTAANPILYVSSSDPRISSGGEANADTNSGVITRLIKTNNSWQAVDIIRGLPRSEQSHATNGLALSADGKRLYIAQGGNTNNGAPSRFFSYINEYALSGTILEVDLSNINRRAILTDPAGGQNGTARKYVYNLPTLDDPSVENDGTRESKSGRDLQGPWGGNDGFNMSILPANAPLRIYADGFRNHYDIVVAQNGNLYTVDNGSNDGTGGDPIRDANGIATTRPNDGGTGNAEPLFLIEEGNYYGHPNPIRANQTAAWTVYDNSGNPDETLTLNSVPNLSTLVPRGLPIEAGFVIDPKKFTGEANRLSQSGRRIQYSSPVSEAIALLGSSSNGLVEYTADAFDGALKGALLVAQFNGNVTLLNINDEGTDLEPLIAPGADGQLGTEDDITLDEDGIYPLLSGFSTALDVTTDPDGNIWVAEIGGDFIKAFSPTDLLSPPSNPPTNSTDFDNDGLNNKIDRFIRDASNGTSVVLLEDQTLLWDFDANQDNNLPGPDGYGGGLTGVMVNGRTDFEQFFLESSDNPGQNIKLDNVKFITASGGGTTVIEKVSNGQPLKQSNRGEYLFHTGVSIAPEVETFTIRWSAFNPGSAFKGPNQQIGGYIGTGDQRNYLKIAATRSQTGKVQFLLEDKDELISNRSVKANDLFAMPAGSDNKLFFELTINTQSGIATPTVLYETPRGDKTLSGPDINLKGTAIFRAIKGSYKIRGQQSGLAVGLFASNTGQPQSETFQAVFDDIEISSRASTLDSNLPDQSRSGQVSVDQITVDQIAVDQIASQLKTTNSIPLDPLLQGGQISTSSNQPTSELTTDLRVDPSRSTSLPNITLGTTPSLVSNSLIDSNLQSWEVQPANTTTLSTTNETTLF